MLKIRWLYFKIIKVLGIIYVKILNCYSDTLNFTVLPAVHMEEYPESCELSWKVFIILEM